MAKKMSKKELIAIISASAIALSGAGVGIYFGVRNSQKVVVDESLAIPVYQESGNGLKVTGISNPDLSKVTKIIIPNSYNGKNVTSIDKGAFKGCAKIKEITLPFIGENNETSIGDNALFGWVFGDEMFSGVGAFTYQNYLVDTNQKELKYAKYAIPNSLEKITINGAKYVAPGAFSNCRFIESIELNDCKATSIGNYAFSFCSCLYSFDITSNVTVIDDNAFERCYTIQEINIPEGVTKIGNNAFTSCISANKVSIPSTVTSMGNEAFHNVINGLIVTAANKESTNWPSDWVDEEANVVYQYKGDGFFYKDNCHVAVCGEGDNKYLYLIQWIGDWSQATVTIPDEITINGTAYPLKIIGCNTFLENNNIITLNFGKNVESIGTSAFQGCIQLKAVNFNDKLKTIGASCFEGCSSLNSHYENGVMVEGIDFKNVEVIHKSAFKDCISITSLNFTNKKLTTIGESAFENNVCLEGLFLPNTLKSFGERSFYGCFKYNDSATTITYPKIIFESGNDNLDGVPAYCFANCGVRNTSTLYPRQVRLDFEIGNPKNATYVGDYAFADTYIRYYQKAQCPKLSTIGERAFYNSKMAIEGPTFYVTSQTTKIGKEAFRYCTNFPAITFLEAGQGQTTQPLEIGDYAFADCANVDLVKLSLPDRVTKLGEGAFRYCSYLQQLKLPNNPEFTTIPYVAFNGCTNLKYSDEENMDKGIIIPKNVTTISSNAFSSCSNIEVVTKVEDPDGTGSLKAIGSSAFSGCASLITANMSFSKLDTFGTSVFYNCSKLKNAPSYEHTTQEKAITVLPSNTYANNAVMESITIADTITTLDTSCFFNCSLLKTVKLNGGASKLSSIGASSFQNCVSLDTMLDQNDVAITLYPTNIGESSFSNCTSLKEMNLTRCSTIRSYALQNCTNLGTASSPTNITLRTNNITMGTTPFVGWTSNQTIHLHKNNFKTYSSSETQLTSKWSWTFTKTSGNKYTCPESGSSDVVFVIDDATNE